MSNMPGFQPTELGDASGPELEQATAIARQLSASIDDAPRGVSPGFSEQVMAAIADEPSPARVGFLAPLRRRGALAGFAASIRQAWTTVGSPARPVAGRAAALAYVLAIALAGTSLVGAASLGVAGSLGLFNPIATSTQAPPNASPAPSATAQPEASERDGEESLEPSESSEPEASQDPTSSHESGGGGDGSGAGSAGSGGSRATARPTDDHGGDDGPESSDDHSGSGADTSDDGSRTPQPSESPD